MPKLNQNVSEEVIFYRQWVSFLRKCEKQDLDAEVWAEYMERHPLEEQPNYSAMKAFIESWEEDTPEPPKADNQTESKQKEPRE